MLASTCYIYIIFKTDETDESKTEMLLVIYFIRTFIMRTCLPILWATMKTARLKLYQIKIINKECSTVTNKYCVA